MNDVNSLKSLVDSLGYFYWREANRLFKSHLRNPSEESWSALVEKVKQLKKKEAEDEAEFQDYIAFLKKQDEIDELQKPSAWPPSRRHSISDPTLGDR